MRQLGTRWHPMALGHPDYPVELLVRDYPYTKRARPSRVSLRGGSLSTAPAQRAARPVGLTIRLDDISCPSTTTPKGKLKRICLCECSREPRHSSTAEGSSLRL